MKTFLEFQADVFEIQWGDATSFQQLENRRKWAKSRHAKFKDEHDKKPERPSDGPPKRRRTGGHGFTGGDGMAGIYN